MAFNRDAQKKMCIRDREKKYDIDGHKEFYLSTVVFQYTTAQPEKKKLQAIDVYKRQPQCSTSTHTRSRITLSTADTAKNSSGTMDLVCVLVLHWGCLLYTSRSV